MNEILWYLQDLDTQAEHVFTELHEALHFAEQIVGNRAVTEVPNMGERNRPGYLYGPGNGSTRVMIRGFTRETLLAWDVPVPPLEAITKATGE